MKKRYVVVWTHKITGEEKSRTLYDSNGAKAFADQKKLEGFSVKLL